MIDTTTQGTESAIAVAFVNNFPGPTLGGGEVQLLTLLSRLPGLGVSVRLVCAQGSALEQMGGMFDGVTVSTVDFDTASLGALSVSIAEKVDGVDIVQGTGFLTNVLVRNAGARVGARIVNTVHVVPGAAKLDGETWVRGLVRRLLDRSHRDHVDRFVAVSHAVAAELEKDGIAADRIEVIANGVDVEQLGARAARELGGELPRGWPRVGYVGRLERVKGGEYFLKAAAKLAQRYPEPAFVIAGEGSQRPELERLSADLGIADKVAFVGHVPDPAPWMAAMNVVVVPSLSEAFGLTALEAMAIGTPVVASAVGGLAELVSDGESGLLVPPSDPQAIAAAVMRLVDEPDWAAALVDEAKRRVEVSYRSERMVVDYVSLYRGLLVGGSA